MRANIHTHTNKIKIFAIIQMTAVIPGVSNHSILESSVHGHALKTKQTPQTTKSSSDGRTIEKEN